MNNLFIIAFLVTLFFFIFKIIEMKYLEKNWKPMKVLVRDAFVVFICSIIATFIFFNLESHIGDFLNIVTVNTTLNPNATQIFTDDPGF